MLQPTQVSQNQSLARTSTALSVASLNGSIFTAVSTVGAITPLETAPAKDGLNPLIKPSLWTPIQLFILEHELCRSLKNYNIYHLLYYIDDFLNAGPAYFDICANNLHNLLVFCDKIYAPIKPSCLTCPTTCLTFLGIQIDTLSMEASIISEQKQSLLQELRNLHSQHKCIK